MSFTLFKLGLFQYEILYMNNTLLTFFALFLSISAYTEDSKAPNIQLKYKNFFKDYCVNCHGSKKQKGKIRLDNFSFNLDTVQKADQWQKILNSINSGEMPPEEEIQPPDKIKADFLEALSVTLDAARKKLSDNGRSIIMRRLNKREYLNNIKALLGVVVDADDLPDDDNSGTYDTVGASLYLSADQIEHYLKIGRKAIDLNLLIAGEAQNLNKKMVRIEPEYITKQLQSGQDRSRTHMENYTKWKKAGGEESQLAEFGFKDKSHAEFAKHVWDQNNVSYQRYLDRPKADRGMFLDCTTGYLTEQLTIDLPNELPEGDYIFRVKTGRMPNMPEDRAFLSFVEASPIDKSDLTYLANRHITAGVDSPEIVQFSFRIKSAGPRKFMFMEKRPLKNLNISLGGFTRSLKDPKRRDPILWIDWVEWEGPLNKYHSVNKPTALIPLNNNNLSETDFARKIITSFTEKAFRGKKADNEYVDSLVKIFKKQRSTGEEFNIAIRTPLSIILTSPGFLYHSEPGNEKNERLLSHFELANRLSHFLWSSPPDKELLELAQKNKLSNKNIIHQVDRMLKDERSRAFIQGFVFQWLDLKRLGIFQFDPKKHRQFDESLKEAAVNEVLESFGYLLQNNQSIKNLLDADYVIVNGLLANYYDLKGVQGDQFRKVSLPKESPRGGFLGMAAILAMGSNGDESNPVERGTWVLKKILNSPPPPAPKNVPQLSRLGKKLLTTRERLLAHQEDPQCAHCHQKIDPIGFGLENFDAIGKWRTKNSYFKRGIGQKTWEIDPSGKIYKGPHFKNFFELKQIISSETKKFAQGLTEELLVYALGRQISFLDKELIENIVNKAEMRNFIAKEFIYQIVLSKAFKSK